MKPIFILHFAFITFFTLSINAEKKDKKEVHGWIKSSWGGKRKFKKEEIPGIEWFLKYIERSKKPKNNKMERMNLVADLTYSDAIQIEIYSIRFLQVLPDNRGVKHIPQNDLHCVKIKKKKQHELFPKLNTGEALIYHFGSEKIDLVLDLLTVPLGREEPKGWPVQILYCIDDGRYGDDVLSRAISWRLFDRGLGWPQGKIGKLCTYDVVEELKDICTKYQSKTTQNWCLSGMTRLVAMSKDPELQKMLEETETLIKENAKKEASAGPKKETDKSKIQNSK